MYIHRTKSTWESLDQLIVSKVYLLYLHARGSCWVGLRVDKRPRHAEHGPIHHASTQFPSTGTGNVARARIWFSRLVYCRPGFGKPGLCGVLYVHVHTVSTAR